ncbi:EamA domain-containing membrane protein RarD [Desulfoluna spongiiphila]|uniref:EamA domain-containing membrane protein RarD n=2 Tax=Desulfoluna spongiiphila TaxID=419481 RepID=A0A1G5HR94_9BACT|nr:EamA domain-containing membrane protein RarD [Desulfoluna spongiiphila]
MEDRKTLWLGIMCALGATALWAGNFIVARGFHHSLPPVTLAFWRWFFASAVLFPFALPHLIRERARVKEHLGYLCLTAFSGVTLFNTLVYVAGLATTALNLSLIAMVSPLFIVILAWLFQGEGMHGAKVVGTLMAFFGVLLLITGGSPGVLLKMRFNSGDLLMMVAALIFAFYSLLVRQKPQGLSMLTFLASTFFMGLAMLAPAYFWERGFSIAPLMPLASMGVVAYLGIFAALIAYALWNRAIMLIGPGRTAVCYYLLPLFSGVEAMIFLGEPIGWVHLVSAGFILSGVALSSRQPG